MVEIPPPCDVIIGSIEQSFWREVLDVAIAEPDIPLSAVALPVRANVLLVGWLPRLTEYDFPVETMGEDVAE